MAEHGCVSSKWDDESMNLLDATKAFAANMNYTSLTPVQEAVIKMTQQNKDIAAEACTGSGKTVAFLVPVVEALLRKYVYKYKQGETNTHIHTNTCEFEGFKLSALIVAPTRELTEQIYSVAQNYLSFVTKGE